MDFCLPFLGLDAKGMSFHPPVLSLVAREMDFCLPFLGLDARGMGFYLSF
jgi:hypothetical protein